MATSLFGEQVLRILDSHSRWHFRSSLFENELTPVEGTQHRIWMASHGERHPAREILLGIEGVGIYGYCGNAYSCQHGSVFLFDSYEEHDNYYPPFAPPMVHLWIALFEDDVVAKVVSVEGGRWRLIGEQLALNSIPQARYLSQVWTELATSTKDWPPALRRAKLFGPLIGLLARLAEFSLGGVDEVATAGFQEQVIATIRRHVASTAGKGVPLDEAARLSGYSKFHFLRLFKEYGGQTYHEYVNECRVRKVQVMRRENFSQTEMAKTLGFSHPSAFLRWTKSVDWGESLNRQVTEPFGR